MNEINISKRWVINNFFKSESTQDNNKRDRAIKFIELTAENITERLRGIV